MKAKNSSNISEAKLAANRKNAQKSTGPRTEAGKRKSSQNARRHGFLALDTCLPGEDLDEFDRVRDGIFEDLRPVGVLEELCCENIVDAFWRLRRVNRVERDVLLRGMREREAREQEKEEMRVFVALASARSEEDREKILADASKRLGKERLMREGTAMGAGFAEDAGGPDALGKLSRYETAIERRLFANLSELRDLQAVTSVEVV